jgi:hypothetical protein
MVAFELSRRDRLVFGESLNSNAFDKHYNYMLSSHSSIMDGILCAR